MHDRNRVTLLFGGPLRSLAHDRRTGLSLLEVEGALSVEELLGRLGVPVEKARILLLNHKKARPDSLVRPGDRLAVFPPELAFNLYVALELAHGPPGSATEGGS